MKDKGLLQAFLLVALILVAILFTAWFLRLMLATMTDGVIEHMHSCPGGAVLIMGVFAITAVWYILILLFRRWLR